MERVLIMDLNVAAETFVLEPGDYEIRCPGVHNAHWIIFRMSRTELFDKITVAVYSFFDVHPAGEFLLVKNAKTGESITKTPLLKAESPSILVASLPDVSKTDRLKFEIEP